jgi:cytochrome subunit of sulfide dehydrogenase
MHCQVTESEYDARATDGVRRARGRRQQGEEPSMKRLILVAAGLALAVPAGTAAAQDGRLLAMSCMNCHGPGGKSRGEIPSINGKSEDFIKVAMTDFRDGKRTGASATVMPRIAKGYSDAEIDALAKYVATLK